MQNQEKQEDIEVLQDTFYYIPKIIRILDRVDNSNLSTEEKTLIMDTIIESNEELSKEEKTFIRDSVIEKTPIQKMQKQRSILIENIKMLIRKVIFIVLLFYILFFHIFGFFRIPNQAMSPNIAAGDLLLYYRLDKDYHVGDVVIIKHEDKCYALRIIALENQVISLNINDEFLVDGELETHQIFINNKFPTDSLIVYPYTVPKGKVFVVGDYRVNYNDSRLFGAVDVKNIRGKVISFLQTKDI